MGVGVVFTLYLDNAKDAFNLLLSIGAGTGLIYLLRWFWWRINAWSEVSAMISSFLISIGFFIAAKVDPNLRTIPLWDDITLLTTVATTTIVWVAVTFSTPPASEAALEAFYAKVRPAGPGWARIRAAAGLPASKDSPADALAGWVLGLAAIYGALFATGAFIYGHSGPGALWGAVSVAGVIGLVTIVRRTFTQSA
jgi:solute:Na+ symporter, SSS family